MVRNAQLIARREALGLTRQGLARILAARLNGYSPQDMCHWLARVEGGRIKRPTEDRRLILRDVLRADSDADLGFDRRSRVTVEPTGETVNPGDDDMNRRALLGGGGLSALALLSYGANPDLARSAEASITPEPPPAHVGDAEVRAVALAVEYANQSDNAIGGGLARASVGGQLGWAYGLLGAEMSDPTRQSLCEQVARLGEVYGWMLHDAGQQTAARDQLMRALGLANEAGVPDLRALILTDLARQAVSVTQDAGQALDATGFALVRQHDLSPAMRGMVYGVTARAYALRGDERETLRAIGTAEDHYADHVDGDSYPVTAQLWGDTGGALERFALNGRHVKDYAARLLKGAETYPPGYERSRAFCLLETARVQATHGDPSEAISTGARGVLIARSLRSARVNDRVGKLSAALAPHDSVPAVADFRAELAEVSS